MAADYQQLAEVVNVRLQVNARLQVQGFLANMSLHWVLCLKQFDLGSDLH